MTTSQMSKQGLLNLMSSARTRFPSSEQFQRALNVQPEGDLILRSYSAGVLARSLKVKYRLAIERGVDVSGLDESLSGLADRVGELVWSTLIDLPEESFIAIFDESTSILLGLIRVVPLVNRSE